MKSVGHVAFFDGSEWFEVDGELFRAALDSIIDNTGRRFGRWESSLEAARRFPTLFPFLEPAADVTASRSQAILELNN